MLIRGLLWGVALLLVSSGCARPAAEAASATARKRALPAPAAPLREAYLSPKRLPLPGAVPAACTEHAAPASFALPQPVTFGDFWAALATQIDALDSSALDSSFEAFAAHHHADASSVTLRRDFKRLWAMFEATRDGGWWRLRWQVTDQEPSSVQIWKAWQRSPPTPSFTTPSAVAECDEISALFSVAARRLGVRGVGLFYPTWNHVIAGWAPEGVDQSQRGGVVLIPTTQIFQGCPATFDQTSFKPPEHVYEFPKVDVHDPSELSADVAEFLLEQVRVYGEASPGLSALMRAKRADLMRSSLGDCDAYRRDLRRMVQQNLTCSDRRALRHLATVELGRPDLTEEDALSFLGEP